MTLEAPAGAARTSSTDEPNGGLALSDLREAARSGMLDLPLPGGGQTRQRWDALASWAEHDLVVARIAEGHCDAVAILSELVGTTGGGRLLGVWAANDPARTLRARRQPGHWVLSGAKRWCSGAFLLGAALVTAQAEDGPRLFLVDLGLSGVHPCPGTWPAIGMAASDSLDVAFDDVRLEDTEAIGGPRSYTARAGFWHGSAGVAACWYGGARALSHALAERVRVRPDEHRLAHLGAVSARLEAMEATLHVTAASFDQDPTDRAGTAERRARVAREVVEAGASEVLERVGRAMGAGPLCHDRAHAQRVADLGVYLRQSHAEADQARLGRLVADGGC